MKFKLRDYQNKAIEQLATAIKQQWASRGFQKEIFFKSPTGSGKTIMLADLFNRLESDFQLKDKKAFIWVTFNQELYQQSKEKISQYTNSSLILKDYTNLFYRDELKNNEVFFVNWQKIKSTNKENRKLRQVTEESPSGLGLFDHNIKETHDKGLDFIMIIDESHIGSNTQLAKEILDVINPRIIVHVSATPKNLPEKQDKYNFINVNLNDVKESGLVKQSIEIQKEEEIEHLLEKTSNQVEQVHLLIRLAYQKRESLKKIYDESNIKVNPLVLIHLPNTKNVQKDITDIDVQESIYEYLKTELKVSEHEIAFWLEKKKVNLSNISDNNSKVNFLFFKYACATGWDCPRAQVLAMYRETKSPEFITQVLGRLTRTPEAKSYDIANLDCSYVFTNYNKGHIDNQNLEPYFQTEFSKKKENIEQIRFEKENLDSQDSSSTQNQLNEHEWQPFLREEANNKYKSEKKIETEIKKEKYKKVFSEIIVDASIEEFDKFAEELVYKGKSKKMTLLKKEVEYVLNHLCYDFLSKQDNIQSKFSGRSGKHLKNSLSVWLDKDLGISEIDERYSIMTNLLQYDETFKTFLSSTLSNYRNKYQLSIKRKQLKNTNINIPPQQMTFNQEFEIKDVSKNVYDTFYFRKNFKSGEETEWSFIEYLESQENIDWWHKQGDHGKESLSIIYEIDNNKSLFYPDFIVKTKSNIYILEVKGRESSVYRHTKEKAETLQKYLREQKLFSNCYVGGIVKRISDTWHINNLLEYDLNDKDNKDWKKLEFI